MSTEHSIVVVDDAKFSAAIVAKKLKTAGYKDVRTAHHADDAIKLLNERPCEVLIADWLMPDVDGIELCQRVRATDAISDHFTYCLLITAKEGSAALISALQSGLDDFILKSDINTQLVARVQAGLRTSIEINATLAEQQLLRARIAELEALQGRDQATGIGTLVHAEDALLRTLQHTGSRGGATSYMTVRVQNWQQITTEYRAFVSRELSSQIARKLRALVRPLDEVCKLSDDEYAIIAYFKDSEDCNLSTYRRIHQGLDKQAFKTSAGFIAVSVACATCFVDENTSSATLEKLMAFNRVQLASCGKQQRFVLAPWERTA